MSALPKLCIRDRRIIVVDDDAANDEMKKSALLLSKPAGVRVNIFTAVS